MNPSVFPESECHEQSIWESILDDVRPLMPSCLLLFAVGVLLVTQPTHANCSEKELTRSSSSQLSSGASMMSLLRHWQLWPPVRVINNDVIKSTYYVRVSSPFLPFPTFIGRHSLSRVLAALARRTCDATFSPSETEIKRGGRKCSTVHYCYCPARQPAAHRCFSFFRRDGTSGKPAFFAS